jgi:hypothetical protein
MPNSGVHWACANGTVMVAPLAILAEILVGHGHHFAAKHGLVKVQRLAAALSVSVSSLR